MKTFLFVCSLNFTSFKMLNAKEMKCSYFAGFIIRFFFCWLFKIYFTQFLSSLLFGIYMVLWLVLCRIIIQEDISFIFIRFTESIFFLEIFFESVMREVKNCRCRIKNCDYVSVHCSSTFQRDILWRGQMRKNVSVSVSNRICT